MAMLEGVFCRIMDSFVEEAGVAGLGGGVWVGKCAERQRNRVQW